MTAPETPSLRRRLVALLDQYDRVPRDDPDARLAAYVRGCLSALDAVHLRAGTVRSRSTADDLAPGVPHREPDPRVRTIASRRGPVLPPIPARTP